MAVFDRPVNDDAGDDGAELGYGLANVPAAGQTAGLLLDADGGDQILVPGGDFILNAEFVRLGPDLLLTGEDGERILVRDYFAADPPPDLVSDNGFVLRGPTVEALAGPAAPGQYAQAAGTVAQPIGTVEEVEGEAFATRVDGTRVRLAAGDAVFQGDVVETGTGVASLSIVFVDDSTFAMDANGRMVLDELIFDPSTGEGNSVFSLVKGTFVFVSGRIAQSGPDAMTVETPVATIGVRGTTVAVQLGPDP
ncbi:MAG: FecR domain-containing protein, partial [Proteobacteria bacterium]|nr:FecR domain-containing protein [Pseudomonadota bacterium]